MNHCNEAHSVSYLTHRAMLFMYCKHVAVSIIYLIPGNDQLLLSANSCKLKLCPGVPRYSERGVQFFKSYKVRSVSRLL